MDVYVYYYFKDNIGLVGTVLRLNSPDGQIYYKQVLTDYTISN